MNLNYKKNDNQKLFKCLEENTEFGILQPQNYNPIYNCYFSLSNTNYNNITLNHKWQLHNLTTQETPNIFKGLIKNENEKDNRKIFLKYSPLLDPIKYLIGKYDITDPTLLNLPTYNSVSAHSKVLDYNNAAYVDSFFTYLSSKVLHEHGFSHGLDYYGSFLSMKRDFRYNIADDIEYMNDSIFFKKNDKILYEFEEENDLKNISDDTRNYKKKINLETDCLEKEVLLLSDIILLFDLIPL